MDERALTERLIAYDTSHPEGVCAGMAFVKGWLESNDLPVEAHEHNGLPVLLADAGAAAGDGAPTIVMHGHVDVVPALADQFEPRVDGDRLMGRGAYDMKGGLAAMMCALKDLAHERGARARLMVVPDEESDDINNRSSDALVARGLRADFAITGEPTDLHIGIQAKGVLALRLELAGTSAHGSTPWLGDNAILKAYDAFRRIETLPFSRESSDLFDRPSINLARIIGGDAFNMVPDRCRIDVDIRFLPTQDPRAILDQIREIPDLQVVKCFTHEPAVVSRSNPYVVALRQAAGAVSPGETLSVGRDGSSDAISFLRAGIPAVEFGPVGGGHHGPHEWVSIASLRRYRQALVDFVRALPAHAERRDAGGLRAVEGGLA